MTRYIKFLYILIFLISSITLAQPHTGGPIGGTSGGSSGSANISNVAFGASWDGVTLYAPSKNAVYDEIILKQNILAEGAFVDGNKTSYDDLVTRQTCTGTADSPLAAAPAGACVVAGWIYWADNETAGWNPVATITGDVNYTVMYDGASYVALYDEDGNIFSSGFIITGTDDAIADSSCVGDKIIKVAGAALAPGDIVYWDDADGKAELADANSTDAQANYARGVACTTSAEDTSVTILTRGKMRLDSWTWNDNEGQPLYLSETAGDLTETRYTSASSAVQQVATIESDDEILVDPKLIDFSQTRYSAESGDGQVLTCLEATNTIWTEATDTQDITLPAVSTCPTLATTIITIGAIDVDLDVNVSDRQILDGTALSDGDKATSPANTAGSQITCIYADADGPICQSDAWTDGN